jgi:hypothetical protein
MFKSNKLLAIVMGAALVVATIGLLPPADALAVDGTWGPPVSVEPHAWSDTGDWLGGIVADGIGAVASIDRGGNTWYDLDIGSDVTLGSWLAIGGGNPDALTTSGGAKLTWDTGDATDSVFRPLNGGGYNVTDNRNMVLTSNLNWGDGVNTQRHAFIGGTIEGPGKLTVNIAHGNGDNEGNYQTTIRGGSPNTYSGGTDVNLFVAGGYGWWVLSDVLNLNLNKSGALGTGDVTVTDAHGNIRIQGGSDRIDDGAALKLISSYDTGYFMGTHGYFVSNLIIDNGVNETVDSLYMNGYQAPAGVHDKTTDPLWIRGDGSLTVTNGVAVADQTSTVDGTWNDVATWGGGAAPSYFDGSSIGHAVTVAADAAAKDVVLTAGGDLTINSGQTLLVQNTFDPSGGTVTINGTLDTVNLASTTGLTLGGSSTLNVNKSIVVDNDFDTTANNVQLPGSFTGDKIEVTSTGTLTVAGDLNRIEALDVDGTLNSDGNVLFQYGGRLSGSGTIDIDAGRNVELSMGSDWTARGNGGVTLAPGDDGVGTLTVKDGNFILRRGINQGNPPALTYVEWEIGQPGETDVVAVVGGGELNLDFSNSAETDRIMFKILDGGGYVENITDKLDMFTYDVDSSIVVNEVGGLVQGIDSLSFDTSALDGTWTVGTLEMWHETLPGGGGHVYLTGLVGGTLTAQTWDGTDNAWNSEHWLTGPTFPVGGLDMVVDSGTVNVLSDVSATPGAARSLSIGLDAPGGTVIVDPAGTLAVDMDVSVANGGRLDVNGALSAGGLSVDAGGALGLGDGATVVSPLAGPDLSDVTVTIDGTLEAGAGVATIGDEDNDLSSTNVTLGDGSFFDWTFTAGDDYVDVNGEVTIAGGLTIQLVDGGGTASGDDVALFRALDASIVDISSVQVLSPAGLGWTWDTDGGGNPVLTFGGEFLVLEGLVTGAAVVPGDTNGDGIVNDADLANLEAQFGGAPGAESADFDGDGDVDAHDFATMRGNWGFGTAPAPLPPGGATPEPATMSLLAIGGLMVIRRRRRKA